MNKLPNVKQLVECGFSLAEELEMKIPSSEKLNSKINEVLFIRENYDSAKSGIITNDELVNLMMAHFQTLVCNNSGKDEPSEQKLSEALRSKFQTALFG